MDQIKVNIERLNESSALNQSNSGKETIKIERNTLKRFYSSVEYEETRKEKKIFKFLKRMFLTR